MGTLQDDTKITRGADGVLSAELSRDWEIWGPSGGYVAAIALRAAGAAAPQGHRPASFSCQYLSAGPFGPVTIAVEPVRQGRNAWCINVVLSANAKRFLQAQIWTTSRNDGPSKIDREMPGVPEPADLKPIETYLPPDTPKHVFWQNFDTRPVNFVGWGAHDPRGSILERWFRFRGFDGGGDAFLDSARALLLIDTVQWPAFHTGLKIKPDYIAPSLDVSVWFHDLAGPSHWLFTDARTDVAGGGLIHGHVDIWSEDGRPIASGASNMLHVPPRT